MNEIHTQPTVQKPVKIELHDSVLDGDLAVPQNARGVVLFAHGSGSSRHSVRNRFVAEALYNAGIATLLMDLLTHHEEELDAISQYFRFDMELLPKRIVGITDWLRSSAVTCELPIGYFGASTGAGAALAAAAERPNLVRVIVSRGGRPDLACGALPRVHAPTLFIVGGHDSAVIPLNVQALEQIEANDCRLEIVPHASHLFEEEGALEQVAQLTVDWFIRFLPAHIETVRPTVAVGASAEIDVFRAPLRPYDHSSQRKSRHSRDPIQTKIFDNLWV